MLDRFLVMEFKIIIHGTTFKSQVQVILWSDWSTGVNDVTNVLVRWELMAFNKDKYVPGLTIKADGRVKI
jgi:hypothetical protein